MQKNTTEIFIFDRNERVRLFDFFPLEYKSFNKVINTFIGVGLITFTIFNIVAYRLSITKTEPRTLQTMCFFGNGNENNTDFRSTRRKKKNRKTQQDRICVNGHINSKYDIVCKYEPGAQLSPKIG